ncbi:CGNR zinc finger domain-containing protein [Nocardia sp. alder85J]|uniref:CGNR zinc finger domain-containing protein n=1 Tax=Nocardia sp. alder85J TaxID=2862949 RepID=UPI001CD3C9F5|nr:ABATE domain-containing protein [Nocardia sp. alder85J]MCX4096394.1 CGNR zinc finger domain-containing protein [Nocardia sp. alder85J]
MFTFVSGNLALDFAGTVEARSTEYRDTMTTATDLANWLTAADLLDAAPGCDAEALRRAVELREAVYRSGLATLLGEPLDPADLRLLNERAQGRPPTVELTAERTIRRTGTIDDALAAVARSAIELHGGPDRLRLKQCGRDDCTRLYVDTSRGGSRRWCDMAICGNRAKSAAFRQRHGT